ncbi:MAG: DUF547 domain-containing protein, partial [Saprospiraceae bacterium]
GNYFNLNGQDVNSFFQLSESFFKSAVEDGKVNYSSLQNDKKEIEELVILIAQISPEKLTALERKAFLINTYNLLVINEVISHYPISSTQKVNGFFEKIKHKVGNNQWTLNQIENDQIRKEYNDPRVHFVLNCAAVSCPPVTNFAYFPALLDGQLDAQTTIALNDSKFIYEKNGKNYISNIFKWYKSDFTEKGTVIDFINEYRTQKLNLESRTIHYPYDWILNDLTPVLEVKTGSNSFIQTYTPSSLLKKNQLEVQLYNNLYTQTAFRNDDREKVDLGIRENYFTGLINILYGVSENRKWNVGLDINLRTVRIDEENSSPLSVLSIRKNDRKNRSGVSSLGPTVKFAPFKNSKISIKSSFLIPITKDNEGIERIIVDSQSVSRYPFFDWDRFTWWNQFFYDKNIGSKWQLFLEADLLFRFAKSAGSYADNNPRENYLDTPVSGFISYFPSEKSTVYFMLQYSPRFGLNKIEGNEKINEFNVQGDFAQTGIGFKYQISNKIGLEVLYTNFFTSANQGAGNTFNFGIRYIN